MRQIDAGVSLERPTIQGLRHGRERDSRLAVCTGLNVLRVHSSVNARGAREGTGDLPDDSNENTSR